MSLRAPRLSLVASAALAALAALVSASPAAALDARTESAAKAALKRAAEKYLATDYAAGTGILRRAARACGPARCSPATKAAVLRDLGVMQFRDGDPASAAKSFADALALQPDLTLGPDYDTPDVRAAFESAKGSGSAPAELPPPGDFTHTPAAEQKVNTPLPVYAEISGVQVSRVLVKYKGAGMKDWARVDMKRVGQGWGALIPCTAVTAGAMRYWVQGFDSSGEPTASSGDPGHPFEVPIRTEISAEAPHLPGRAAPQSCDESGAPAEGTATGEGGAGSEEASAPVRESGPVGPAPYARWWIGVAGAVDFLSLPQGDNLCALNSGLPANASGYYCTNPDGSNYPSRTSQAGALVAGQAGHVGGGSTPAICAPWSPSTTR